MSQIVFLAKLTEAFNEFQRNEIIPKILHKEKFNHRHDRMPEHYHDDVFAKYNMGNTEADRIIIPTSANPAAAKILPNSEVLNHLMKHGWTVHDYVKGTAIRESNAKNLDGSPKTEEKSIGSILKDTGADSIKSTSTVLERVKTAPHPLNPNKREPVTDEHGRHVIEKYSPTINQLYESDPLRSATKNKSGYQIVISRNKEDVMGMSTGRAWSSCMRLPKDESDSGGCNYSQYLPADLAHQTLSAYLTKKGDDNIESPISRINIKRLTSDYGDIYRPFGDVYGEQNDEFKKDVHNFAVANYKSDGGGYRLHPDLYDDNHNVKVPTEGENNNVVSNTPEDRIRNDYSRVITIHSTKTNAEGQLHTDNDEPSAVFDTEGGATTKLWHKNGLLHRDNGPAVHIVLDNSDNPFERFTKRIEHKEYYQHGLLHSPKQGGIPSYQRSIYNMNGNEFHDSAFHKFGLGHNDPIHKVSSIRHRQYEDGTYETDTTKHLYGREYEHSKTYNGHIGEGNTHTVTNFIPNVPSANYGANNAFPIHNFISRISHYKDKAGRTTSYESEYAPGCELISHTFKRENDSDEFGIGTIVKNSDPKNSRTANSTKNIIKYRSREPLIPDNVSQEDLFYEKPSKVKQQELFKK